MPYQFIRGVPVWGAPLENAVDQMANCARNAAATALMADHHLGYAVPIGGVKTSPITTPARGRRVRSRRRRQPSNWF